MKNTLRDTFVYLGLIFIFVFLTTAAIKSIQPTEQDLIKERNRIEATIKGNNEITVSSEHELQLVKEILNSQNQEIVDITEESRLVQAPGRINQLLPKTYYKVTYKPKDPQ